MITPTPVKPVFMLLIHKVGEGPVMVRCSPTVNCPDSAAKQAESVGAAIGVKVEALCLVLVSAYVPPLIEVQL